jgi:hypothetical protein
MSHLGQFCKRPPVFSSKFLCSAAAVNGENSSNHLRSDYPNDEMWVSGEVPAVIPVVIR